MWLYSLYALAMAFARYMCSGQEDGMIWQHADAAVGDWDRAFVFFRDRGEYKAVVFDDGDDYLMDEGTTLDRSTMAMMIAELQLQGYRQLDFARYRANYGL